MELKEIVEKIGVEKLQAALKSDDPGALQRLLEEEHIELSEDQLDYIAGGYTDMFTDIPQWIGQYDEPVEDDD